MSLRPGPSTRTPAAVPVNIDIATTRVDGRPVKYSVGGSGPVLLFLHGWGLGHHAYRPGLRRLANAGYTVVAPALPGFGGTAELPHDERTFAGYADWVCRFAGALGLRQVIVVGHSFGGGVALKAAASCDGLAQRLVMLNSVGASWRMDSEGSHAMAKRPLWSWGLGIPSDALALLSNATRVMPSVLEDLLPNVMRNPFGLGRVGKLARNADLAAELLELRARNFPITVAHSENDGVIPMSSFQCLCTAAGVSGILVPGNHSWPLTDPDRLLSVIDVSGLHRHVVAA